MCRVLLIDRSVSLSFVVLLVPVLGILLIIDSTLFSEVCVGRNFVTFGGSGGISKLKDFNGCTSRGAGGTYQESRWKVINQAF